MLNQPPLQGRPAVSTRLVTACCSWLVCSPPRLAADTPAKRLADRLLPRPGWPAAVYFAAVAVLLAVAPHLPDRAGLGVTGIAALGGGAWCAVNFWRCRQAHCVITGLGWLADAAIALTGAGVGHSLIGGAETLTFLGVLGVGVLVEAATYLIGGSYTFSSPHRPTPMAVPSTPSTMMAAGAAAAQQSSSPAADQATRLP